MTDSDPGAGVEDKAAPRRRRVRVRKRVTPRFHLSRKRQQFLLALVIALAAAAVVAWFVGSSVDNPEAYVPGGALR